MLRENLRILGAYSDKLFIGPRYVKFHINSRCNFNCLFCWYHSKLVKNHHEKRDWSFEKFKELIDDCCAMGVEAISILGEGEPFLHPRISDMIDYIKKRNMCITIDTNCSFDTSKLKKILDIDLLRINISAATPEKHRKIQFQKSDSMFYRVLKNIRHISEVKKKLKLEKPVLHIVYIINKYNFEDIEKMLELCSNFDIEYIEFKLMQASSYTKSIILSKRNISKLKHIIKTALKKENIKFKTNLNDLYNIINRSDFLREIVSLKDYNRILYFTAPPSPNMRCYAGWYYIHIDMAGNVFSCCNHQQFLIGNIYKDRLKNIWDSKKFHEVRMKYKYDIDLGKKLWAECRYCPMIEFNKDIQSKINRIRNRTP